MKIQRLLVSSFFAITVVVGASYGAFEYWVNLQTNMLPQAVTKAKLTEVSSTDVDAVKRLATLLYLSPLPWHQQRAQQYTDLMEVAEAAQKTFDQEKVSQLRIGNLLTLQQELEDYVDRYPTQAYTAKLQTELPAVRALVTFFPIIKSSAADRSTDSALRASRRGATLTALVIRRIPEAVAEIKPTLPVVSWSKAENDALYDYSQALQVTELSRVTNSDQLRIGHQVCSWLQDGQGYWGIRSLFDSQYKTQIAGNYYHNRDAYIRFSTERLCPQYTASLMAPPDNSTLQIAAAPVVKAAETVAKTWNGAANVSSWSAEVQPQYSTQYSTQRNPQYSPQYVPQYGPVYPVPFGAPPIAPGGVVQPGGPGFPSNIR